MLKSILRSDFCCHGRFCQCLVVERSVQALNCWLISNARRTTVLVEARDRAVLCARVVCKCAARALEVAVAARLAGAEPSYPVEFGRDEPALFDSR